MTTESPNPSQQMGDISAKLGKDKTISTRITLGKLALDLLNTTYSDNI
jgi:hypothetical protein